MIERLQTCFGKSTVNVFSPSCVLLWPFIELRCAKVLSQSGHLYGFSFVWVFMCDFSEALVLNARSHSLHGTCLESEWHERWYCSEVVVANFFSQGLQENLPSFLRMGFLSDTILGIPVPDAILFVLRLRLGLDWIGFTSGYRVATALRIVYWPSLSLLGIMKKKYEPLFLKVTIANY